MSDGPRMRTSCPKCGARYRLDAQRLKGKQANIKCSSCATVFRVRLSQPSRETSAAYTVTRAATGAELAVPSLDTLKRWIIEGRVQADDAISNAGGTSRRVGDIAQFDAFLRVGEQSGAFETIPVKADEAAAPSDEPATREADADADADAEAAESADAEASTPGTSETAPDPAEQEAEEVLSESLDLDASVGEDVPEPSTDPVEEPAEAGAEVTEPASPEPDERDAEPEAPAASASADEVADAGLAQTETDDELPVRLDTGTGRKVVYALLVLIVMAAIALAALYVTDPDSFFGVFPFLE